MNTLLPCPLPPPSLIIMLHSSSLNGTDNFPPPTRSLPPLPPPPPHPTLARMYFSWSLSHPTWERKETCVCLHFSWSLNYHTRRLVHAFIVSSLHTSFYCKGRRVSKSAQLYTEMNNIKPGLRIYRMTQVKCSNIFHVFNGTLLSRLLASRMNW